MTNTHGDKTLCIIKPDAVRQEQTGAIINMIEKRGFRIMGMRMCKLTQETASAFYEVHAGKPFFKELTEYMTSGPIVAIALQRDNAVNDYRDLIGATDPAEAAEGTVRKLFGVSKTSNAVHGSDSDANAQIEIGFFFSRSELV